MTLADILLKAAGIPADKLRELAAAGAEAAPDLAPIADTLISRMDEELTTEKWLALVSALTSEAQDIAHGELRPRSHPSDAA